jgi:glycine oxidase
MSKHILVIGGGVIGLSAALECRHRGHEVTVLEANTCGGQASGAAAGMLAPYSEAGDEPDALFQLCQLSLRRTPDWVQKVEEESGVSVGYRKNGSLQVVFHEADAFLLESKRRWLREAGAEAEVVSGNRLGQMEPGLGKGAVAALWCPEEAHIYSPDYVQALQSACRKAGVRIREQLGRLIWQEHQGDKRVESPVGEAFEGDEVVLAAGAWSCEWEQSLGIAVPVHPIRGQICAYTGVDAPRHLVFTSQGYLVAKPNGTLVCGASEDVAGFDTRVTERGIRRLESWNKDVWPALQGEQPFHRWAGLRPATQDGFPLIGRLTRHPEVILATGHYRNGILMSPITAEIIADLVDEKSPALPLESYHPERFAVTSY